MVVNQHPTHYPELFEKLGKMTQVPRAIADQVLAETQHVAKTAKERSGLTNVQLESALCDLDKQKKSEGSRFSELLNGRRSACRGLVGMHNEFVAAGYIDPPGDDFGIITSNEARRSREVDFAAEAKKAENFYKARNKAAQALQELAEVMAHPLTPDPDRHSYQPSRFLFSLLRNYYLREVDRVEATAAEQVDRLAGWVSDMSFMSTSGWDWSKSKSGAKVVHSEPKLKPKVDE
ncbi:hypothetical protein [Acidovorax sp. Root70]|uniref:hypothetical protein n=1 Tax=Acidovorax sp. Root70 TaxID=1736590 RepID=UPI0006FEEDEF|nr:hypothetical protein [Acidovorax sp. Root70]KRB27805.1 hypothetical protein ASD94_08450 [Acidovorax sp. Root70]